MRERAMNRAIKCERPWERVGRAAKKLHDALARKYEGSLVSPRSLAAERWAELWGRGVDAYLAECRMRAWRGVS